jgi:hypothetical protein
VLFWTLIIGVEFYSTFFAPLRWFAIRLRAISGTFAAITTYLIRGHARSVVVAMAMGLEDYRHQLPPIKQYPTSVPKNFGKYEDIPEIALERACDRRDAWISHHIRTVTDTFSKLVVTPTDTTSLLQTIEADQSLVHAAYYTDDECIARIASWIADNEAMRTSETISLVRDMPFRRAVDQR